MHEYWIIILIKFTSITENSNSDILLPTLTVSLLVFAVLMFIIGLLSGILLMNSKQYISKNDTEPVPGSVVPLYEEIQPPSAAGLIGQEFIKTKTNEAYEHI